MLADPSRTPVVVVVVAAADELECLLLWSCAHMILLVRIYISGNVSNTVIDFSAAMAELTRLTLTNIPFDLQIAICIFLRPIDIFAFRKVCH